MGTINDTDILSSISAAEVKMRAIKWIWPNRFAYGKVGILAGLPDVGKGQVLSNITANITNGDDWPCNEGKAPKGNVILLTAEDDIEDTVVPRLAAAGADLARVEIVRMVHDQKRKRMFNLATDLDLLRQKIKEVGDVVMVQIDPITAYLGTGKTMDSFRTTDVRAVLGPVVDLAAEMKVSILAIMHFNKNTNVDNALLRISDSLAFGATARHVYAAVDDPDNERKLIIRAKNNLAANTADTALAYRFGNRVVGSDPDTGGEIRAPHIVWEKEPVNVTAIEAMQAAGGAASARDDVKQFLADLLASGPVASDAVKDAAKANGISERTLFRAKRDLGVEARKDGPDGTWNWRIPTVNTATH
jgi:hypothetical protein